MSSPTYLVLTGEITEEEHRQILSDELAEYGLPDPDRVVDDAPDGVPDDSDRERYVSVEG